MQFLYELTFPNGKSYVGIAVKPGRRMSDHIRNARNGHDFPVHHAIRKYGADQVRMQVLACGSDAYISDLEIRAIKAFDTRCPRGYNVAFGGRSAPSSAPETREKIRQSKLRHWSDPAYRERIRKAVTGMVMTLEQNRKNGEAKRKNWADPDYRAKTTASHIGKKHSAETIEKRRIALAAAWAEGKGREARTAAMQGRLWFNNGVEHRQLRAGETSPSGWVRGMLKKPVEQLRAPRRAVTYIVKDGNS